MSAALADLEKRNAGRAALDFVKDGMIVGLGTGSTAAHFVRGLGERVALGLRVRGVPTSEQTRRLAIEVGIDLLAAEDVSRIDVTVDGADEVDPSFRLIKGGGGALLREKIIAAASDDYVIIADSGKTVDVLGNFPLPVEVTPFAVGLTARHVEDALATGRCRGRRTALRRAPEGGLFTTDGGNRILDCLCERIEDAEALALALSAIPGVVEHGLFIGMARTLIVGTANGADIRARPM
jgi:ribose 5-phosphate isomerase A